MFQITISLLNSKSIKMHILILLNIVRKIKQPFLSI